MMSFAPGRRAVSAAALAIGAAVLGACSAGPEDPSDPPAPPGPDIQLGAYLPDDGLIVIEFESGSAAGDWSEEVALSGFTGTSYLRWDGPDLFQSPGHDTFGFDFWIDDPGTYQFRIHNRHDDPDSTMSNDVFVRMDGGDWIKVFSSVRGHWTWASRHEFSSSNKPEAEYDLAGGNHRIEFSGRSFDFSIDRFHLYDTGVSGPLDTAHPESSRHGMSGASSGFPVGASSIGAMVEAGSIRTLVLGPVVARRDVNDDPVKTWDLALSATVSVDRTVEVAVVGASPDWSNDFDPILIAPALERQLRDLPVRWRDREDLRWTFEAGPTVVPATLDDLARMVRLNDPGARALILRITPEQVIARWPDVLHSSFDGVVLLRTAGETGGALDRALELIDSSGRSFDVAVRGYH